MEKLDSAQLDQLKEIGAYLRQVRQEQSRSLEEIAAKTCIRLPLLRALELGQEQILPEPVFVQGFIRRYADILGLDGTSLSQSFPVHTAIANPEVVSQNGGSDRTASAVAVEPVSASSYPQEISNASLLRSKRAYVLYGILGVLVLGGVAYELLKPKPQPAVTPNANVAPSAVAPSASGSPSANVSPNTNSATPSTETQASTPSASASPIREASQPESPSGAVRSPATSTPSPAATGEAPVTVNVRIVGDESWIEVVIDGQRKLSETLVKGTQRTWSAKREIVVISGNAGAVSVTSNTSPAKTMGNLGEVKEMRFTPKSP